MKTIKSLYTITPLTTKAILLLGFIALTVEPFCELLFNN